LADETRGSTHDSLGARGAKPKRANDSTMTHDHMLSHVMLLIICQRVEPLSGQWSKGARIERRALDARRGDEPSLTVSGVGRAMSEGPDVSSLPDGREREAQGTLASKSNGNGWGCVPPFHPRRCEAARLYPLSVPIKPCLPRRPTAVVNGTLASDGSPTISILDDSRLRYVFFLP